MSKKVYIGVGHGGSDSGAVANGLKEKDVNLEVAKACLNYLADYCTVKISRTKDVDSTIDSKCKEANSWGADAVVEIHHNAGGGDGAEVYYSKSGGTSKTLAQNVLNSIVAIGQQSRGIKTKTTSSGADYFGIIRNTNAPAVLVECAFLDSKDKAIVDTAEERKKMGEAIAKGIITALNLKKSEPEKKPVYSAPSSISGNGSKGYFQNGDKNEGVYALKMLLTALKSKGIIKQAVDNNHIFGNGTEKAIKELQKVAGIEQDGYAGPITIRACYELLIKK